MQIAVATAAVVVVVVIAVFPSAAVFMAGGACVDVVCLSLEFR